MKTTTIITAKIDSDIYKMIDEGQKLYEVRGESFQNANIIRYVDDINGEVLGMYVIGPEDVFDRTHDQFIKKISGVNDRTFRDLFPKPGEGPDSDKKAYCLYVVPILCKISMDDIFQMADYD